MSFGYNTRPIKQVNDFTQIIMTTTGKKSSVFLSPQWLQVNSKQNFFDQEK